MGGYEMPEKIRKFHLCNNVHRFQYDRPFHRGTKAKDNEFKVSHLQRL
jgi:dedicator of cytokinesis protein 4